MDCSLPASSVHEILQARVLEWIAMPSSRGYSQPRDQTCVSWVSCTSGRFFTCWATWEAPGASVPGQPTCNGPNVCAPFRSPWRWVFKEVIKVKWGHKGGFSSSRIGDLVRRRIRELPHSLLKEDIARCGQASASWEENLTRNWKGWHLDLGPPASRTVRNNFLLLKLQVAQVSCYGNTSRPRRMVYIEFCLHVQNECIMHISLAHRFPWFRERS